jgi:hypothetical protein
MVLHNVGVVELVQHKHFVHSGGFLLGCEAGGVYFFDNHHATISQTASPVRKRKRAREARGWGGVGWVGRVESSQVDRGSEKEQMGQ